MNLHFIDILGVAMLLIWALRMIRDGITQAFGAYLKHAIAISTRNRFTALGTGFLVTLALQSSTAMSLITAGFVSRSYMTTAMALAVMLGANIGTALAAKALSLDTYWLAHVLILVGGSVSIFFKESRYQAIGKALFGLGLTLLALKLIGSASEPLRESLVMKTLFAVLNQAPIVGFLVCCGLTLVTSSSLPVIFLILSFATAGNLDPQLILYLVVGINVGGAIIPLLANSDDPIARRVPFGNLLTRSAALVFLIPAADYLAPLLKPYTSDIKSFVFDSHLAINILLALIFLPFVQLLGRRLDRLFPAPTDDDRRPRYLDKACLSDTAIALSCAARETMRIGDAIDTMLKTCLEALRSGDGKLCEKIQNLDDKVDAIHEAIKMYLAELGGEAEIGERAGKRSAEIMSFAVNLEHVGDIIDKSLRELVKKRNEQQVTFSEEGLEEMTAMFSLTRENLRAAQSVFVSDDIMLARRLANSKVVVRRLEQVSTENHLQRLRAKRMESVRTSTIHLDVMRDLRRINAHLISASYPILEGAGELRESRLRSVNEVSSHS